jgi:nucleoid-associated protein YgaU
VAEAELGRRLGRVPTDEETDPYWRALVEANRDRLVDPDNPDLIFSGQQLVLPPTA